MKRKKYPRKKRLKGLLQYTTKKKGGRKAPPLQFFVWKLNLKKNPPSFMVHFVIAHSSFENILNISLSPPVASLIRIRTFPWSTAGSLTMPSKETFFVSPA